MPIAKTPKLIESLMTLHSGKAWSFSGVLVGMEQGLFPSYRP